MSVFAWNFRACRLCKRSFLFFAQQDGVTGLRDFLFHSLPFLSTLPARGALKDETRDRAETMPTIYTRRSCTFRGDRAQTNVMKVLLKATVPTMSDRGPVLRYPVFWPVDADVFISYYYSWSKHGLEWFCRRSEYLKSTSRRPSITIEDTSSVNDRKPIRFHLKTNTASRYISRNHGFRITPRGLITSAVWTIIPSIYVDLLNCLRAVDAFMVFVWDKRLKCTFWIPLRIFFFDE